MDGFRLQEIPGRYGGLVMVGTLVGGSSGNGEWLLWDTIGRFAVSSRQYNMVTRREIMPQVLVLSSSRFFMDSFFGSDLEKTYKEIVVRLVLCGFQVGHSSLAAVKGDNDCYGNKGLPGCYTRASNRSFFGG